MHKNKTIVCIAVTLDVLISTIGDDGIARVASMRLPRMEGVRYLVGWQMPGSPPNLTFPHSLMRDDVAVIQTDSSGLSVNRNLLIEACNSDICLIADDDIEFTPGGLRNVVRVFEENDSVDVATFMIEGTGKSYPAAACNISRLPKGYWVSSCEIAFRTECLKGRVWFDKRFGIGAPRFQACEDALFLLECRRAGLCCTFFPVVIAAHHGASTGMRALTPGIAMAEGAYIRLAHGIVGIFRLPIFACRAAKSGRGNFLSTIYFLTKGFFSDARS